jgi:hypothetical protein
MDRELGKFNATHPFDVNVRRSVSFMLGVCSATRFGVLSIASIPAVLAERCCHVDGLSRK